jgi:pyruvate-formate lyase-activating enzyme
MKLSLEIPDEQAQRLQEAADRLGIDVKQLAEAAITDLTGQQAADFEAAAARVLRKNKELYERLS